MKISNLGVKERATDQTEHRIAEIPMKKRHCAAGDAAGKAITHDQIGAVSQSGEERIQPEEIVAVVGVSHDHESTLRRSDPCPPRRAVAAFHDRDDASAAPFRERS